jgi:pilus assembly protein CpaF
MFGKREGHPAPRKPDPAAEKPTAPSPQLKVVETPAPAPAQPKAAPAPAQPEAAPTPEQPEAAPASAQPEAAPAPAQPEAAPTPEQPEAAPAPSEPPKKAKAQPKARTSEPDQRLEDIKVKVFNDLLTAVDLSSLTKLDPDAVREEIGDVISEIITIRNLVLSAAEQDQVISDICNDVLGLGPIEPLLDRDDIADIMVNGSQQVYIETNGRIVLTDVKFRDDAQLMNVCQRIVSAVGRRIDEASPICDARLLDGSRVNVIVPPLALDGPVLTIRKFTREKLTLHKLIEFGSLTPPLAKLLEVIGGCRINVLISGGTGSGKTTLLNCLTRFIAPGERTVTCEDAAELQLQQPHVVRLETRPPNLEGIGEVTMRDLVRNCLRMRPERIIVGEVRGPEAFDLLQAMNTGHDGSMGTVHANSPRDAISRLENMIAMGGFNLPVKTVREQIAAAITIIIQVERLRDGSRKITHVSELVGMESDVVTIQHLYVYEIEGEDEKGRITGHHRPTGLRPNFWDRARYYGLERPLAEALSETDA